MALPTSYTKQTLITFMKSLIPTGTDIDYTEAINDVLLAYGVDSLAEATDIAKLRSIASVMAWRATVRSLVATYDFSADGGNYKRSQMKDAADAELERAEQEASLNGYLVDASDEIVIGAMGYTDTYSKNEVLSY